MKKLMTSTIILLPLLILAIMLVSGAIMSLVTHIYVEAVEFVKNDTLVLYLEDETQLPSEQLEVNVLPLKAENRDLVYTVEDESVATVDENGVVTGQYFGETYVTVTSAENKAAVDKLHVLVTDTSVHKVVMSGGYKSDLYMGTAEERTQTLSVTVVPAEANEKRVIWTSSDENILTVSPNGTVTANGAGKATVTATSVDNPDAFASVDITCHTRISSIKIEQSRVVTALSKAKFPDMTMEPADADVTVAFTSSDPSVATVDGQGNITFLNPGQVRITATATDFGGRTAEASNDYVSTLGYYRAPLFDTKEFTVDYDEFKSQNKALPIPFATNLADTYREVMLVEYTENGVLDFDKEKEEFRFTGEMPDGVKTLTVTVTARGYDTTENKLVTLIDAFSLIVLRRAQSISVAYNGTDDADFIALSSGSLTIGTLHASAAVKVFPTNYTDSLTYTLENAEGIATLTGGMLTFQKAGTVTVKISSFDSESKLSAAKRFTVTYAPAAREEHKKEVEVAPPAPGQQPEKQQVLLSMDESAKEEAMIYFTEPAGTEVTYEVKEGKNDVIELREENGVRRIVPKSGGFATVEIAVTKSASPASARRAARSEDEPIVYTIEVYVDRPVMPDSFSVTLGGTPCDGIFGTALSTVPFTVSAKNPDGELEGKKFFVSYGETKTYAQTDGLASFSGNITFKKEDATLTVTFGVEYSERAVSLGAKDGISSVTRTIRRNAESIEVSYKGVPTETVTTSASALTLKPTADQSDSTIAVVVLPANHTNAVSYALVGESSAAAIEGDLLVFSDPDTAASVTVKVEVKAFDGSLVLSKQFTVSYTPEQLGVINVEPKENDTVYVRLRMNAKRDEAEKGKIDLIEPAGATVDYRVEEGNGVLSVEEDNNVRYLTPKQGGFATVVITVTPSDGAATTYTIKVYVDRTISVGEFAVAFDGASGSTVYGTVKKDIPFTVVYLGGSGAMVGKKLYVSYGTAKTSGTTGLGSYNGTVAFPETLRTLSVTVGVEYDASAQSFGVEGGIASVERTLERNTESISVTYKGIATENIVFGSTSYTVTEKNSLSVGEGGDIRVALSPATHTDTLSYTLEDEDGIAQFSPVSGLTFQRAGTVTLLLQVKRGEKLSVEKRISVTYAPVGTDVAVELAASEQKIALPLNDTHKEGILYFSAPAGEVVTYDVRGDQGIVTLQNIGGVYHIVPEKGGFAEVTVTAGRTVYTVGVYVDTPVSADDFTISFAGKEYAGGVTYTTSLTTANYNVEVADKNGSMAGKQLVITVEHGEPKLVDVGTLSDSGTVDFGNYSDLTFTVGVQYAAEAKAYGTTREGPLTQTQRDLHTTKGNLDAAPTVNYGENNSQTLSYGQVNTITFDDIGETVTFTVDKTSFSPADFTLKQDDVKLDGHDYVTFETTDDGAKITLKATNVTDGEKLYLNVKNYTFELNVIVCAKAQTLSVSLVDGDKGETPLSAETDYTTLLDALFFKLTLGRGDSNTITNKNVEWSFDEHAAQWNLVESGHITIDKLDVTQIPENIAAIFFRSADGGATFTLKLKKVTVENFSLKITATGNGDNLTLQETTTIDKSQSFSYALSSAMQGSVTLHVEALGLTNCLGGFGTDAQFAKLFPVNDNSTGWTVTHTAVNGQIVLSRPSSGIFNNFVILEGGAHSVTLNFSSINLAGLEFVGFNSATDNHRGYQQVRVFAKQSTYKSGDSAVDVDYFRMPVSALAGGQKEPDSTLISLLSWTLTAYKGNAATEVVAQQAGANVTCYDAEGNEVNYTVVQVEGGYVLQDSNGNEVVNVNGKYTGSTRVTWVDAFSEAEAGYVRIYFGGVKGLSETDVQNDLFGNFDERADWKAPQSVYDITGKPVTPTNESSFSFLRVEGGDGVKDGGINAHFNFNVLEGSDLFNVDTATAYYAKSKVVLQKDLYGGINPDVGEATYNENETEKTSENEAQFITVADTGKLNKALVIGNGHSVSFNALNAQGVKQGDKGTGGITVRLQKVINTVVKGSNPVEKLQRYNQIVVMVHEDVYYSDIQYYSKISPWGANASTSGTVRIKNTVLRCTTQSALQLYYKESTAYIENVVLVECVGGFVSDSQDGRYDVVYNFKGFVDVLNYMSFAGLVSSINQKIGMMAEFGFDAAIQSKEQYLEWFGKTPDAIAPIRSESDPWLTSRLFNVFLYNRFTSAQNSTLTLKYWNQEAQKYQTKEEGGAFENGVSLATPIDQEALMMGFIKMGYYRVFVYDTPVALDGGLKTDDSLYYNDRDMSQLFSSGRYSRLLCQYLDIGDDTDKTPIKNTEHILWHMQRAYRDPNLIAGRIEDHEKALKQSLINARDSHKWDGEWPDNTSLQDALDAIPADVAALSDLLSETVLPSKRSY